MIRSGEFFKEASIRLLSGTHITETWQDCLNYLRNTIPADFFSLHLFNEGLSVVETVVDATPERSDPVSQKSTLTPEASQLMQNAIAKLNNKPACVIIDDLSKLPHSRQLGLDLGTPDSPCLILHLFEGRRYLGIAALTNTQGRKYTNAHAELFLSLHPPPVCLRASCLDTKKGQPLS